ncbi:FKBP-type peptidyl-prolyl cis-trans isomerase N-terminal domain-containing protein [Klebsiella aerogenes]|uniref:FKBP-type peptidyl-prolyl cis-trans isomerase N-terminal domain-containing protein n=1 Tax=Klebsiella TaxID=570 RepID=UPI000DDC8B5A|nr:FKBP-type peptidyl-prolyl cis-trans isomerase N-terminal domain-containing protein [Klebsiella aerogenes]EKZ9672415.1 FKBP-type peptidyl-prolyl cis-trans isomerase [Klebsiella aerogenes]MDQ8583475.1 FKBP-type peptidyl-prolyl cis-trans isomerase N-terminal domain-containing protein [Klebsiella aerogenes]HCR0143545.1 FKBP-type peptidyl-prolyl cis-trans isomerase [Klebsiella aerogenes]HDS6596493.1 FKBP-type peptidyl-prolyl cis-trans isomerase [Klebsiella aerogenes]
MINRLNILTLAFILLASLFISHAHADDGAPAFLNYVQQQEKKEKKEIPPAPEVSKPAKVSENNTAALHKKLAAQKILIADKDKTIRQLQAQLKSPPPARMPATVDNAAMNNTIEQLQRRIAALDTENKRLVQQVHTVQQEKVDAADNLKRSAAALQAQKVQLNALETDKQALSDKLATAMAEQQKLSAELAGVKTTAATTAKAPTLNLSSAPQQQAYSVGVSIGQDALKTLSSQAAKGLNLQQETVLKGINDVFAGKPALDEQARNKALFDVSQRLYKNIDKLEQHTLREGKKYQQQFAAQKGVALKAGIYSRIDYPGKGKVADNDIVTVVIKESLIDGTVINDMEAEDKVWSQALSQYPATFREPLKRLNNHGAITIVVPPERAYGSKGIPGKIPPGSTMVYTVRIVDARPNSDQQPKASAPKASR